MGIGTQDEAHRPQLVITMQQRIDAVVLTLVGEIDIATVADITATIDQIVANNAVTAIHIDAAQVTFADSAGLRSLVHARHAAVAHGLRFTLRTEPGGQVERVIAISGLDGVLTTSSPHRRDHPRANTRPRPR